MPITVNRPARSTMGFIHGGGAAGLLGLWRQNASSERKPPGAKISRGKPEPWTS
jgi:hypothetical protein